jgi:hypothetical protein
MVRVSKGGGQTTRYATKFSLVVFSLIGGGAMTSARVACPSMFSFLVQSSNGEKHVTYWVLTCLAGNA